MIYFYRAIYFIFRVITQILNLFMSKKNQSWITLRSNLDYQEFDRKGSIWFHASSGEIEYCKSVITEIRRKNPQTPIILSYSSPSAEKLLFNIKNQLDLIFPLPWDSPETMSRAIQHLMPSQVIFSRTDFWPEFIYQLKKNKVKTCAISMYPNITLISRLLYLWLIQDFDLLTTVSQRKSEELSEVLHREVLTFPDTRFDQVFSRLQSPSRVQFSPDGTMRKKIVFASTWPEDEDQILPCLPEILGLNYQVIICPHEINHTEALFEKIKKYKVLRLSTAADTQNISSDFDILLIDKVGFLADVYRFTDLAFVGGSFKKKIHSVMEPLCCKNVVFFGPHFKNNPEAAETEKEGLSFKVSNSFEMMNFIRSQKSDQLQKNQKIIQEYAEKHRGSSILVSQVILNTRPKPH